MDTGERKERLVSAIGLAKRESNRRLGLSWPPKPSEGRGGGWVVGSSPFLWKCKPDTGVLQRGPCELLANTTVFSIPESLYLSTKSSPSTLP